jgi:hypothetical protein
VSTAAKNIADVNAKSSDVGTSFTRHPEDTHISLLVVVEELALVNGTNTELFLDCRDQRRSLEDWANQARESLLNLLNLLDVLVKLDNCDVLFTSRLLSLDKTGGIVNAGNEATCDFRIEGTRVT